MRYLLQNQVVRLEGRPHKVVLVNDCRALCVPLAKRQVTVKPLNGKPIIFQRAESGVSVSPTSDLEILGILRDGIVTTRNGERIPEKDIT